MTVEILFPEVCSLYGDLMNIEYLVRSCPEIQVVRTSLKETPAFVTRDDVSLIYMGTMTERAQELVIAALLPHKGRIMQLILDGTPFLITGNALEIFGKYIECDDGSKIDCLGIFGTYAVRRMMQRYNSLYIGKFGEIDIVGFKSQFTHSYGDAEPLFETVRGDGLHPGTMAEGVRRNNFMATYVIGPLLILNPDLTVYILDLIGAKGCRPAYEEAAYDVFRTRLREFSDPNRGFTY